MEHPKFELDTEGFPLPGPVIRYYRQHMTYTDKEGRVKIWTQADLAKTLRISEWSVRMMETKNQGLDSIERRRTLAKLLNIPPVLLGLASIDQLQGLLHEDKKTLSSISSQAHKQGMISAEEVQLYKDALPVLKDKYDQGDLQPLTVEAWIKRIRNNIGNIPVKDKSSTLQSLVGYSVLAGRLYSHDRLDWLAATRHLNSAKQIAIQMDNPEVRMFVMHHIGEMYFVQKKPVLAQDEFDYALSLAKGASPQVIGRVLTYSAIAHAMTGHDRANTIRVERLLEQAEKCVQAKKSHDSLMRFDDTQYLRDKADALICLQEYNKAFDAIEDADAIGDNHKRGNAYLMILSAECYIKQKQPEYDQAVTLLLQVLKENSHNKYYVDYVARLHKLLATSRYSNAPDVVHLGMHLRTLQGRK